MYKENKTGSSSTPDWENKFQREKKAREKAELSLENKTNELKALNHYLEEQNKILEETQKKLHKLISYDLLTGLANRQQLEADLKREIARAERHHQKLALVYLDIDQFKKINDRFGHKIGDVLLKEVTARLRAAVRIEDVVARLGGDEFAAILTEIENPHQAGIVANRIIESMKKPFRLHEEETQISVNIGVAFYPDAGDEVSALNQNASIALESAKELGKNNYQFFTSSLEEQRTERLKTESELHFALARKEFFVEYQPRIDLQTGKMVGMEALLRWKHPLRGIIPPNDFISIAEETGLIIPIGEWIFETACKQFAIWLKENKDFNVALAINVSPLQFQHEKFIDFAVRTIKETHIPPHLLELEITETATMSYLGKIENALFELRNLGVQFSIDDFGKGYSSLERLKELPIQSIKIDRSFVTDIDVKVSDNLIVKSTIELGKGLGLNVIAEGVETESQLRFLVTNQCPQAQGYYYSKPLSVEKMRDFIKKKM